MATTLACIAGGIHPAADATGRRVLFSGSGNGPPDESNTHIVAASRTGTSAFQPVEHGTGEMDEGYGAGNLFGARSLVARSTRGEPQPSDMEHCGRGWAGGQSGLNLIAHSECDSKLNHVVPLSGGDSAAHAVAIHPAADATGRRVLFSGSGNGPPDESNTHIVAASRTGTSAFQPVEHGTGEMDEGYGAGNLFGARSLVARSTRGEPQHSDMEHCGRGWAGGQSGLNLIAHSECDSNLNHVVPLSGGDSAVHAVAIHPAADATGRRVLFSGSGNGPPDESNTHIVAASRTGTSAFQPVEHGTGEMDEGYGAGNLFGARSLVARSTRGEPQHSDMEHCGRGWAGGQSGLNLIAHSECDSNLNHVVPLSGGDSAAHAVAIHPAADATGRRVLFSGSGNGPPDESNTHIVAASRTGTSAFQPVEHGTGEMDEGYGAGNLFGARSLVARSTRGEPQHSDMEHCGRGWAGGQSGLSFTAHSECDSNLNHVVPLSGGDGAVHAVAIHPAAFSPKLTGQEASLFIVLDKRGGIPTSFRVEGSRLIFVFLGGGWGRVGVLGQQEAALMMFPCKNRAQPLSSPVTSSF